MKQEDQMLLVELDDSLQKVEDFLEYYRYKTLKQMYKNYFSGKYIFSGLLEDRVSKIDRELTEAQFNYYLEFYKLINFNWKKIRANFMLLEIPDFEQPGKLFTYYLNNESQAPAPNKRTLYDAWQEYIKCLNKSGSRKKLESYIRRLKRKNKKVSDNLILLECILSICERKENFSKASDTLTEVTIRKLRHTF